MFFDTPVPVPAPNKLEKASLPLLADGPGGLALAICAVAGLPLGMDVDGVDDRGVFVVE